MGEFEDQERFDLGDGGGAPDGDDAGADDGIAAAFPGAKRTGAGRPKGAPNRKTLMLQQYYKARGFRDPVAYLGELMTGDPLELLGWFRTHDPAAKTTLLEIVKLQQAAAGELMPYLHGKMPARSDQGDERLPVLIIDMDTNQVSERRARLAAGVMSAGAPLESEGEEIQEVSDDEANKSHGE